MTRHLPTPPDRHRRCGRAGSHLVLRIPRERARPGTTPSRPRPDLSPDSAAASVYAGYPTGAVGSEVWARVQTPGVVSYNISAKVNSMPSQYIGLRDVELWYLGPAGTSGAVKVGTTQVTTEGPAVLRQFRGLERAARRRLSVPMARGEEQRQGRHDENSRAPALRAQHAEKCPSDEQADNEEAGLHETTVGSHAGRVPRGHRDHGIVSTMILGTWFALRRRMPAPHSRQSSATTRRWHGAPHPGAPGRAGAARKGDWPYPRWTQLNPASIRPQHAGGLRPTTAPHPVRY